MEDRWRWRQMGSHSLDEGATRGQLNGAGRPASRATVVVGIRIRGYGTRRVESGERREEGGWWLCEGV